MSEMICDAKATTPEVRKETKTAEVIVIPCEDIAPAISEDHPANLSTSTCASNLRALSPNWRDPKHRELSPDWRKPPSKDRRTPSPNRRNGARSPNRRTDANGGARSPNWRNDANGGARSPNWRNDVNGGARSPNWRNPSPNDGRALSPNWRKTSPKDLRSSSPNWRAASNPSQERASSNTSQRARSRSPRVRVGDPSGSYLTAGGEDDVVALDSSNFSSVLSSGTPWLVMFSAPWCGPCKKLKPAFQLAASKLKGKVHFGLLNGDLEQNQDLVRSFASEGFPSLYHFPANGGTPEMYGGGRKTEEIVKWARAFILG